MIFVWLILPGVFLLVAEYLLVKRTKMKKGCFTLPVLAAAVFLISWVGSLSSLTWDLFEWGVLAIASGIGLFGAVLGGLLGWDFRRFQGDLRMRKRKKVLRLISLGMFLIAVVFVVIALSCPTCGSVFYIGNIRIGSEIWRIFYAVYAVVMVLLFALSFFVKKKK